MQTLYSIGEVHQMTGFSVPTLRYYADMGIVVPEKVDTQTGYRYYSFDDIRRLETVGYLKKAGFSLNEIAMMMQDGNGRDEILGKRLRQTRQQLLSLQEKIDLLEWLSMEDHCDGAGETQDSGHGYRISQKSFESRQVLLTETEESCGVEEIYRQACRQWQRLGIVSGQRSSGYLINENAFMRDKRLELDGQFLVTDQDIVLDRTASYMIPKGNYICMTTPVFRDDRWIRALSRYFAERDIRPRNILAVLKRRDFYDWKQSLYEVQILI